jgi:hypothetical protein
MKYTTRQVLAASAKDVSGARLSLEDVKALVGYYLPTYFAHYELYQHIFDADVRCRLLCTPRRAGWHGRLLGCFFTRLRPLSGCGGGRACARQC